MKNRNLLCGLLLLLSSVAMMNHGSVSSLWAADNVRRRPDRDPIVDIANSRAEKAVAFYLDRLQKIPTDQEICYGLAMGYSQLGDIGQAMAYLDSAVQAGLPFERFLAGPRNLFSRLYQSAQFQQYAADRPMELIHGPSLGAVTDTSACFWVRTLNETGVKLCVYEPEKPVNAIWSGVVHTASRLDFTAVTQVSGLKSDTAYLYDVYLNDEKVILPQSTLFRTYPSDDSKPRFQVAFGGGANYRPDNERQWDTILSHRPAAMLFLGDNVYIDFPEIPEVQRFCYYQRFSHPAYKRMAAATPIYAIYDDHDFGDNDVIGGPEIEVPAWKRAVWRVFKETFNNPYYGGGEEQPGCWFDFSIGPVDFFMLDCRYYHTDPTIPQRSMLGQVQKQWLLKKLHFSHATFKVIASSVPWTFGTKPGRQITARGETIGAYDTWEGFPEEREEIFSFIEENRIEGVYLISADRHRSDAWKIERENGYAFYEASTSHLTKDGEHKLMPNAIFSHRGKPMFGLLTFDLTLPDAEIVYQVRDIDDRLVDQLIVRLSQLRYHH